MHEATQTRSVKRRTESLAEDCSGKVSDQDGGD
jgi:hypothetical protein